MFRLFECCALSFFERFVLSFSLKIERFVSDSAEIWICGLYEDGSFFKIRDITLGYTFKPELLKHLNLSKLRVYATAKNFFTFGKIDNYDPEQGGSISFPMTKQLVFGLNVEF